MKMFRINPRIYFSARNIVAMSDIDDVDVSTIQNLIDLSKGNRRTVIFLDTGVAFAVSLRVETVAKYVEASESVSKNHKS